jgi:hypothetical protein
MLISVERTAKNQVKPGRENGVCSSFVILFFTKKKILDQNRPVCCNIVVEETTCWFSIFRTFSSGRIPKATKDVNVLFYIQSINFSKLYQQIPGEVSKPLRLFPNLRPPIDLVTNYQCTSWSIAKERNHQLSRGGSLKFHISYLAWLESNLQYLPPHTLQRFNNSGTNKERQVSA